MLHKHYIIDHYFYKLKRHVGKIKLTITFATMINKNQFKYLQLKLLKRCNN